MTDTQMLSLWVLTKTTVFVHVLFFLPCLSVLLLHWGVFGCIVLQSILSAHVKEEACMPCSNPLSHANNCVLTDVPCIFHTRAWLCEPWVKSFPLPSSPTTVLCRSLPLHTLYLHLLLIPPHAHFQPLSLKSMELILLGLMDFAAKVRRMHFNHGRS